MTVIPAGTWTLSPYAADAGRQLRTRACPASKAAQFACRQRDGGGGTSTVEPEVAKGR